MPTLPSFPRVLLVLGVTALLPAHLQAAPNLPSGSPGNPGGSNPMAAATAGAGLPNLPAVSSGAAGGLSLPAAAALPGKSQAVINLSNAKSVEGRPSGSPETDALVREADELRRKGDFEAALKKVQEALRKVPKHPQGLLLAGTLEGSTGRLDAALGHLKEAVTVMPDNLFARKVYASALLGKGDSASALETLEPLLKQTTVDPQAMTLAAQATASGADLDAAHRYLNKAFKADPAYVPAHRLAARIALAEKKPEEATRQLQAVVKGDAQDTDALIALAGIEAAAGRVAAARDWLEKARKAKPNAAEPWIASAGLALRTGHADEAATYLPKLESLLPGQPVVLSLKGQVALMQKRPKDAVEPLRGAYAKQASPQTLSALYEALQASDQQAEADRVLNGWIDAHPEDRDARLFGAAMAARRKDYAAAAVQYRKLIEKDPNDVEALNYLAQSLQAQKDPQALEMAERAWKLKPDNPIVENTLGGILMTTGKGERGLSLLRDAAGHAPKQPEIRFDYAQALAASGEKDKARQELEAIFALKQSFPNEARAHDLFKAVGGS